MGDAVEGVEGEGGGQTKDQGDLSSQLHSPIPPHPQTKPAEWPLSTDPGSEGLDFRLEFPSIHESGMHLEHLWFLLFLF